MAEWGFRVATDEIACPKPTCLAKLGEYCKTPKGKQARTPHGERMALMTKAQWARCTGRGTTLGTVIRDLVAKTQAPPGCCL